jgi:formamidopyrimidine-DNA glycosylase
MVNMIELPEAITLAKQINENIKGKQISDVIAKHSEHKFTWYFGNPDKYKEQLINKKIENAKGFGSFVEVSAKNMKILYNEGANLRLINDKDLLPKKHQLLIKFSDKTFLCASIQIYGGVGCFIKNELDNEYYKIAKEKPSPLSNEFDEKYFNQLISNDNVQKLSLKAFLATEQRIPGLGNGVLQDILFNAKIHPKQKINSLSEKQISTLFKSIKNTIKDMVDNNGRNTEKDLFSNNGNYITKMSKNTAGNKCNICSSIIAKGSYMGGSIYYCNGCQKL